MVLHYKKFIWAEESSRQCGKTVRFINGKKLNYPKGKRGIGRKENHKVLKWFLFPSPSSLSKGKRLRSHRGFLASLRVSVCLEADTLAHRSSQMKSLGSARNMRTIADRMLCYSLWSEELREMALICLAWWPSCFIPPPPSSHFSLLPLVCHLGSINGEMGRNHSNYLEN